MGLALLRMTESQYKSCIPEKRWPSLPLGGGLVRWGGRVLRYSGLVIRNDSGGGMHNAHERRIAADCWL